MESDNPKLKGEGLPVMTDDVEAKPAIQDKNTNGTNQPQIRRLLCCQFFLVFLALVYSAVLIAMVVSLLNRAPYEPIFWVFVICLVLYWLNAAVLAMVAIKTEKVKNNGSWSCKDTMKKPGFWLLIITLIVSFACMLVMLRFILPESFAPTTGLKINRLASVTDTTARFAIRDPFRGATAVGVEYRLNGTSDPFVRSINVATLSSDRDYTGFVTITGLSPATAYEWRFDNETETLSFKTNPSAGTPSKFSFYFGSCFLNGFPNFNQAPGFGYVADMKPDLFFFVGDFIYSDIPFFRNDDVATYHYLYRQSFNNPGVQRVFQNTPNYHMWDDHEIRNDFPDVRPSNLYRSPGSYENSISKSWNVYVGEGNPDPGVPNRTFYELEYGDSAFAVIDTRGYRTSRELPDNANKSILGLEQKQWLLNWLSSKNTTARFKFIVSPLGFTSDMGEVIDSWGGFKTERDEIINYIRQNRIEGVMVLSGDSHFAYVTNIDGAPGGEAGGLYEASASPISAFDRSLGGFRTLIGIPEEAFKPMDQRTDDILFYSEGQKGATSLIGMVRVDTTLPVPEAKVELYDATTLIFNKTLVVTDLRAWAGI